MFLRRGWKAFVRAHNFMVGHVLRFKLVEDDVLTVKIYGHSGFHLGCCEESSRDVKSSSLNNGEEEDNTGKDGDSELPAVMPEYDGSDSN
ncbi:L-ascorbate oxidase-like protein [Hordeum vulgare]|nr:L-ascorbate oxidase-like protein [Hordeum vulgare]